MARAHRQDGAGSRYSLTLTLTLTLTAEAGAFSTLSSQKSRTLPITWLRGPAHGAGAREPGPAPAARAARPAPHDRAA